MLATYSVTELLLLSPLRAYQVAQVDFEVTDVLP